MLHVNFVDASTGCFVEKATLACLPELQEYISVCSNRQLEPRLCGRVAGITVAYLPGRTVALISLSPEECTQEHDFYSSQHSAARLVIEEQSTRDNLSLSSPTRLLGEFYDEKSQALTAIMMIHVVPKRAWTVQFKAGDDFIKGWVSRVEYFTEGTWTLARIFFKPFTEPQENLKESQQAQGLPEATNPEQTDDPIVKAVQGLFAGINGRLDALEKLLDGVNDSSTQVSPQQIPVIQEQQVFQPYRLSVNYLLKPGGSSLYGPALVPDFELDRTVAAIAIEHGGKSIGYGLLSNPGSPIFTSRLLNYFFSSLESAMDCLRVLSISEKTQKLSLVALSRATLEDLLSNNSAWNN